MSNYDGEYFRGLVRHFRRFPMKSRRGLADRYGAPSPSAEDLARAICEHPERLRSSVHDDLKNPEAFQLLNDLALQHDIVVGVDRASRKALRALLELGLVERADVRELAFPGALAAVLAPLLNGTRTTFPTLLGGLDDETLNRIAETWDYDATHDSPIYKVLWIAERLSAPGVMDELMERLPELDYLGGALVAIELGGVCYWQEVFGFDLDRSVGETKVVPFMRSEERALEEDMAYTLVDHGVIFRLDEAPHPMLVVPEELQQEIWAVGRGWLLDWVADVYQATEDSGTRKLELASVAGEIQGDWKWLGCEASAGRLKVGELGVKDVERLVRVGGRTTGAWERSLTLAIEAGALRVADDRVVPNPAFDATVDLPRSGFTRQMLFEWCTGYLGGRADAPVGKALGVDDVWRRRVASALQEVGEFTPLWLRGEGVAPEMTGGGYLRVSDDPVSGEVLTEELTISNSIVWATKLIFLDLLAFLPPAYHYTVSALGELLQIVASFAVFTHCLNVLEATGAELYIPLQRASFLNDPLHTEAFDTWMEALLEELFVPLGVAHRAADGAYRLESELLRIPTPAGLTDELRQDLLRQIFGDELEVRLPGNGGMRLHKVPEVPEGPAIDVSVPAAVLRDWVGARIVERFDGREIVVRA